MAKAKTQAKPKPAAKPAAQAQAQPKPKPKVIAVGDWVEVCQLRNGAEEWLPLLVTHVYKSGEIGGVAFSGAPAAIGWGNRGAEPMDHIKKGTKNREWRPKKG